MKWRKLAGDIPHPKLDADKERDDKLITEWQLGGGRPKNRNTVEYGSPLYWALAREDQRKKLAARAAKKGKPVEVTSLNLFTLADLVVRNNGHVRFPNQLEATDRNGIKRCVDGGYVRIEGRQLALTPNGKVAVADYLIHEIENERKHPARDAYYLARQEKKVADFERAMATLGSERAE